MIVNLKLVTAWEALSPERFDALWRLLPSEFFAPRKFGPYEPPRCGTTRAFSSPAGAHRFSGAPPTTPSYCGQLILTPPPTKYEAFVAKYGKGTRHRALSPEQLAPEIYELLQAEGIASFMDGFLWTLDPNEYAVV